MLLVKTRIGSSKIHGIGLFAAEFVPKGTVVWRFIPSVDQKIPKELVDSLPEVARDQILKYAYLFDGCYVMCMDDARHFNSSKTPNTDSPFADPGEDEETIASQDIEVDDEITCDYEQFDEDAERKLS